MALTRETRSLSISNMPYVRPTNPIGDFARTVQRDAAQELKELYAEEDRITVAESVASVYDRAKEIQVSQEGVPDSAAMADDSSLKRKRKTRPRELPSRAVLELRRLESQGRGPQGRARDRVKRRRARGLDNVMKTTR